MNTEETGNPEQDNLRLYIREMESWPSYRPPSLAELEKISQALPLDFTQKHKLQELIRNHIYRYQRALDKGSYNQALIEISRACVLDPTNTRNRVELARVYLKHSPDKLSSSDNHRKRALRLVQDILGTWPDDSHALEFLEKYKDDIQPASRNLRPWYRLSLVFLLFLLIGLAWRERDWLLLTLNRLLSQQETSSTTSPAASPSPKPSVSFRTIRMEERGLDMDITSSRIDFRNEDPFMEIQGLVRVKKKNLGPLVFMVRAHNFDKKALFSIPWEVRRESDPVLQPGDSQPLEFFRWLTNPIEEIESIEISPHTLELSDVQEGSPPQEITVVWELQRPNGARIKAEIRHPEVLEGYDKRILQAELALSNLGQYDLSALSVEFSLPFLSKRTKLDALKYSSPPITSGERRVWPIRLLLPLENKIDPSLATLHVTSIILNSE